MTRKPHWRVGSQERKREPGEWKLKEKPLETKPCETNCHAAASLQHEQSVGRKKRTEETTMELMPRPITPHNGFSSKAAAKMWPKFHTKIGLPDKGIDEQSMREKVKIHLGTLCQSDVENLQILKPHS
ncbi:hypothetical protein L6452_32970 [Arctium lappa]|uniref:Uncharacterized protein n=1 Tax=Arctium lappa TaxID=4217 RepID=A0ACB8Z604_ARCLA|nr:hypothetical protein L6452_32970 [Arctium lappa]